MEAAKMSSSLTGITDYLINQSAHIVVLFFAIAMVCFALKKKTAHVRYLLWLIIIAKCLVPSLLTVSLAILPSGPEPAAAPVMVEAPLMADPGYTAQRVVYATPVTEPTLLERLAQIPPKMWCVYLWIMGTLFYALVVVAKAVRLNSYLVRKRKVIPEALRDEFGGFVSDLPACYMVKGIAQPFVWGLVKGSIYLPANFIRSTTDEHRRQIISHEAGHVERLDPLVNLLQIIAQTIFFFHPLVWVANRMIRAEREKCCDEIAIAALDASPRDYGSAIVETLVKEYESTMPIPSMAIAGPIKNIEDRIKTIMNPGKKFYKRPTVVALMSVLLAAVIAVPTSFALSKRPVKSPEESINIDGMRSYRVGRSVGEFADDDFSTPEAAYAQINRAYASGKAAGWVRVSAAEHAKRLSRMKDQKTKAKYAKELLNAEILEVAVYGDGDKAVVFSRIGKIIDARHVVLEDGKWLNLGHDQYGRSLEEAKEKKLGKIYRNQARDKKADEKIAEAMKDPKQIKRAAKSLFEELRDADYEKVLSYYNKKTGKWKRDGWKKNPVYGFYTVHTDYPSFTLWLCENLKDNPIKGIMLGEVFAGEKEMRGRTGWPTVEYKLILKDGKTLGGELAFSYSERDGKDHWQGVEGIDWHLMDDPFDLKKREVKKNKSDKQRILIEARVLEVSQEFMDYIRDKLEIDITDEGVQKGEFFDDKEADFLIKATQKHADSEILAAPTITVFDGESAWIRTAEEIPYITGYTKSDGGDPTPKIEYIESGIHMEVLPKITKSGHILLGLVTEIKKVTDIKESTNADGLAIGIPNVDSVSFSSKIIMLEGSTVMLGGTEITTKNEDGITEKKRLFILVKPSIKKPGKPVAEN